MSGDVDIRVDRKMLWYLASSSTDPSLFSFSFIRSFQRQSRDETPPSLSAATTSRRRRPSAGPHPQNLSSISPPQESASRNPGPIDEKSTALTEATSVKRQNKRKDKGKMTSVFPSAAGDFWLAPHQLKSPAQLTFSEDEFGYRKALLPQTREIYLHPSQIFSPPLASDVARYPTSSTLSAAVSDVNPDPAFGYSSISLPPILTLDEIESDSQHAPPTVVPLYGNTAQDSAIRVPFEYATVSNTVGHDGSGANLHFQIPGSVPYDYAVCLRP